MKVHSFTDYNESASNDDDEKFDIEKTKAYLNFKSKVNKAVDDLKKDVKKETGMKEDDIDDIISKKKIK